MARREYDEYLKHYSEKSATRITWTGRSLSVPVTIYEDELRNIGKDAINDAGVCVFCKPCNRYMVREWDDDLDTEHFECYGCDKIVTDNQVMNRINRDIQDVKKRREREYDSIY